MADLPSPPATQSIEGRSVFVDWLLLPLLAFCSCGRQVDDAGTVAVGAAPIERQPEAPQEHTAANSIALSDHKPASAPIPVCKPNHMFDTELTRFEANAISCHLTTETDCGSARAITPRLRSIDDDDTTLTDQFKLSDLPLLPLVAICRHLRSNGNCKDLYNFRQTCRVFALAVNTFLELPANLPPIEDLTITIGWSYLDLLAHVQSVNYLMHPVRANRATLTGETSKRMSPRTYFEASFVFGDDEKIESAAESLIGPLGTLGIYFHETPEDTIAHLHVLQLVRNLRFGEIRCDGDCLNDEMGSLILSLLRDQTNTKVIILFQRSEMTDPLSFLRLLYSSSSSVLIRHTGVPIGGLRLLLNMVHVDWQDWLMKMQDECSYVASNNRKLGPAGLLVGQILHTVEWRK